MITRLVDSHIHFWDPHHLHYAWLADLPALNRSFTHANLAQAAGDLPLEKIVMVQADCAPGETLSEVAWVKALAASEPRIQGIVAFAPLEAPNAREVLTELRRTPLVKGVRRLIQSEADDFAVRADFVRGVQTLTDFDLPFDICIRYTQLPAVIDMVRQCPDNRFVLDHFGKPPIKAGEIEPWASNLTQIAAFPNIYCKLSGLITEADHENWTPADLQPYIDHVLAEFGPRRLMFGGDWPVSELAGSYTRWFETAQAAVSHLSPTEQDCIFYSNAVDFYRLG
jgi:L-fuconolactonase